MSTSLQVDLGNSSAKWRLVQQGEVRARGSFVPLAEAMFAGLIERPDKVWVSSVASPAVEDALCQSIQARWELDAWFARTPASCAGLVNSYAEPGRMGVDRWLAMLGARARCEARLCVVDAGSALTIDLVALDGHHEGGYIIPGAHLMEQSLLRDTERVRFDEPEPYALEPGRSTSAAVRHGVALAQAGAVRAALAEVAGEPPKLFYCGGGGEALRDLVGCGGSWAPDLVFEGLEVMAAQSSPG